jgi:hypothetical protein
VVLRRARLGDLNSVAIEHAVIGHQAPRSRTHVQDGAVTFLVCAEKVEQVLQPTIVASELEPTAYNLSTQNYKISNIILLKPLSTLGFLHLESTPVG